MKYYQQPILTDTAVMKTLDEFGVSKLEVGSNENKQSSLHMPTKCQSLDMIS